MKTDKEACIQGNRREYGADYDRMGWIASADAEVAARQREDLLADLPAGVRKTCQETKIQYGDLSPGCRRCAEGGWSCLFINGRCNGRCFFCPTDQSETGEPTTQTLRFSRPADYVAYLERFGFTGASISGGEPFLTFDKTLRFAAAVKRHFGDRLHLWLYTNGLSLTAEGLKRLADAGLDEIRFNIAAAGYGLKKVALATTAIETVTVEIPAIPEDEARLTDLIASLRGVGVRHLNLHQLRCTPRNLPQLLKRRYTMVHGPRVTVLESELSALRTLRKVADSGIDLPVNYCSFAYKQRYQAMAYHRHLADVARKPYESVSRTGRIRRTWIAGEPDRLKTIAGRLGADPASEGLWTFDGPAGRLFFHPSVWHMATADAAPVAVAYDEAILAPSVSYRRSFTEVTLTKKKTVFIERERVLKDRPLSPVETPWFARMISAEREGATAADGPADLGEQEQLRAGLEEIF